MAHQVELNSFDLRYEGYRQKYPFAEKMLLSSIMEHGIREPLLGVDQTKDRILLDGFKRYRCAKKLRIGVVWYQSLGSDEGAGLLKLIRISNSRTLTILEQAGLIEQLRNVHNMSIIDIAQQLEKSKAWVSMRSGIIKEMSEVIRDKIFSGAFPAYSYLYTLRRFIRMNRIPKKDIDDFVCAVAAKRLSIREIDLLANSYFKGGDRLRQQIREGDIDWVLSEFKHIDFCNNACSEFERAALRDFEVTQKYMQRLIHKSSDKRLKSPVFFAQAHLLCGGIMRHVEMFTKTMRTFYDRSRHSKIDLCSTPTGDEHQRDSTPFST